MDELVIIKRKDGKRAIGYQGTSIDKMYGWFDNISIIPSSSGSPKFFAGEIDGEESIYPLPPKPKEK